MKKSEEKTITAIDENGIQLLISYTKEYTQTASGRKDHSFILGPVEIIIAGVGIELKNLSGKQITKLLDIVEAEEQNEIYA